MAESSTLRVVLTGEVRSTQDAERVDAVRKAYPELGISVTMAEGALGARKPDR